MKKNIPHIIRHYKRDMTLVQIMVQIRERRGPDLSSVFVEIPFELIPESVLNPPKPPTVTIPDEYDIPGGGLSANGLITDLTTTRGEGRPFYHKGESIQFAVRLNRKAYLYLFGLGPMGKATLLHPVEPNGQLIKGAHPVVAKGEPLILPDDGAQYNLVAAEPFGTETVWAVASGKPLRMPDKLTGEWADSKKLIKLIRKQGLSGKNGYAEAQVELVTGR